MDDHQSIGKHIEKLIQDDRKADFISFMRKHSCEFTPSHLFKLICRHRAVGCVTALLEQNSGFSIDVNATLEGGLSPLQLAAQSLSFGLTSILLEHGAKPNVCDEHGSSELAMLPLNMALKVVSDQFVSDWSTEKSIFKLLYIFCLQDLKEPLETIRLLAERTDDIEKVSLYFVEEGKIVWLAALLMGAWNRLVPPDVENAEKSLIGEHIWRQIAVVSNQEFQFMINCGPSCEVLECLKSKKINLISQWKFLKVLEMGRHVIKNYLKSSSFEDLPNHEVPHEVAYMLNRDTEMVLKPDDVLSDDIKCLRPRLNIMQKAELNEAIEKQMRLWSILPEPKTMDADQSEVSHENESSARAMLSSDAQRPTGGGRCSLLSSPCFISSRQYHTSGPVESGVPRKLHKVARPLLPMFSSSANMCSRLLLCAKRSIK